MFPRSYHGKYFATNIKKSIHFSRMLVILVHEAVVIFFKIPFHITDVTSSTTTYITYDTAIYISYSKL